MHCFSTRNKLESHVKNGKQLNLAAHTSSKKHAWKWHTPDEHRLTTVTARDLKCAVQTARRTKWAHEFTQDNRKQLPQFLHCVSAAHSYREHGHRSMQSDLRYLLNYKSDKRALERPCSAKVALCGGDDLESVPNVSLSCHVTIDNKNVLVFRSSEDCLMCMVYINDSSLASHTMYPLWRSG